MNKKTLMIGIVSIIHFAFTDIKKEGYSLSDYITTFSESKKVENKTGWAFWFIPANGIADTLSVKMSYVNNGIKTHEPHAHFEDELFYMVEGVAIVHLNGEEQLFKPGDAFYAPGNAMHNICRAGEQPIKYLMFKRETSGGLSNPFLPALKNYTMKDCFTSFAQSHLSESLFGETMWYLKKELSDGGLNAQLHILSDSTICLNSKSDEQEVCFILEGCAEISMNGEHQIVEALSCCYFPPKSEHYIKKEDAQKLKFIIVKTK